MFTKNRTLAFRLNFKTSKSWRRVYVIRCPVFSQDTVIIVAMEESHFAVFCTYDYVYYK